MLAWILNILLPGTGLILSRREWQGFALAVLYGICGNVALAGWLIAPAAIPYWLSWLAIIIAALTWIASQKLYHRQVLLLRHCGSGMELLLNQARSALNAGDLTAARLALESGAALDDENIELHVLSARVCAAAGDDHGRRAAWLSVLRLDRHDRYHEEARLALDEPPLPSQK